MFLLTLSIVKIETSVLIFAMTIYGKKISGLGIEPVSMSVCARLLTSTPGHFELVLPIY